MFVILFFVILVYTLTNITKFHVSEDELEKIIKKTHVYSGIHEESYSQFYANIQLAKENKSQVFLYKAIHYLNDIPLYMSPVDQDIQDEIAKLSQEMVIEFENILAKEAMNTNTYFRSKYI